MGWGHVFGFGLYFVCNLDCGFWFTLGSGQNLGPTAAPLCSLSCNENKAKTKEDQFCPVVLNLGALLLQVAPFYPTASSEV